MGAAVADSAGLSYLATCSAGAVVGAQKRRPNPNTAMKPTWSIRAAAAALQQSHYYWQDCPADCSPGIHTASDSSISSLSVWVLQFTYMQVRKGVFGMPFLPLEKAFVHWPI